MLQRATPIGAVGLNNPFPPAEVIDVEQGVGGEINMSMPDLPHPDISLGYLVSVIHHWTEATPISTRTRGRPPTSKKNQVVKSDRMRLDSLTRYELANASLSLHNLEDEYSASKKCGFGFKMWWTGSSGGKSTAATIETDAEYDLILTQLRASNSKRGSKEITVFVAFDTDEMDAFRVRKHGRAFEHVDNGFNFGTKVPRLADMDPAAQLHSEFILKLKHTHPCEQHRGEHGEVGYCYVSPNGNHLGLNNRRLAIWGAAMAAGEATRHVPPNVAEFDGCQISGSTIAKPRGKVGPAHLAPTAAAAPATATPTDATSLLMAAMVPLLVSLTQSMVPRAGQPAPAVPATLSPDVPAPVGSASAPQVDGMDLDLPPTIIFLHSHTLDCLIAFKSETNIDIVDKHKALEHRELTPDIIPEVPHHHLAGVLGVSEGKTIKFQLFCRRWARNFAQKGKSVD